LPYMVVKKYGCLDGAGDSENSVQFTCSLSIILQIYELSLSSPIRHLVSLSD